MDERGGALRSTWSWGELTRLWLSALLWQGLTPLTIVDATCRWYQQEGVFVDLNAVRAATRSAWVEVRNRALAFTLFTSAEGMLGLPPGRLPALSDCVEKVLRLEPYRGLWTTEGLGYYVTLDTLSANEAPVGLLSVDTLRGVPSRWFVPLHTGMGLGFATQYLQQPDRGRTDRSVMRFLSLCEANSLAGYSGATFEALGLACGLIQPGRMRLLSQELRELNRELEDRLWHGFGRGLYFAATNVLPCANLLWPPLERARLEACDRLNRANVIAGFAWAMTLVNIRHPEVLEAFLVSHAHELQDDAFANGVSSALAVWEDWSPESPYARVICDYVPACQRQHFQEAWQWHARSHCDGGLHRMYAHLKERNRLQDLFRYYRWRLPGTP